MRDIEYFLNKTQSNMIILKFAVYCNYQLSLIQRTNVKNTSEY